MVIQRKTVQFRGIQIPYLYEDVYYPQEDTLFLLDVIERHFASFYQNTETLSILEMGCGTGLISAFLAKKYHMAKFMLVDISLHALKVAETVWELNSLNRHSVSFIKSDLFSALKPYKKNFDVIIFNPPYVPEEKQMVSQDILTISWSGGSKGLSVISAFLTEADFYLKKNGEILLLTAQFSEKDTFPQLASQLGYEFHLIAEEKIVNERLKVWRLRRKFLINRKRR